MEIQDIIDAINNGRIRISEHADEEAQADKLSFDEIISSIFNGEIIEDYPYDKLYPSCLIYGNVGSNKPVHSVWGYNSKNNWVVLITVYRPDPRKWNNWRRRIIK